MIAPGDKATEKDQGRAGVKDALETAAAQLFARQGFGATGVQQIVDQAGVNKAMLYYYFRGKDSLYDALIAQGLELLCSAVSVAEQERDEPLRARLERFLATYLDLVSRNPDLAQIIYREVLRVSENEHFVAVQQFRDCVRRLAVVLESCAHELRPPRFSASRRCGASSCTP